MSEAEFHAQQSDLTIYFDDNDLMRDCTTRSSFVHRLHMCKIVYNLTALMCKIENGPQVNLGHSEKLYQQLEPGCIFITASVIVLLSNTTNVQKVVIGRRTINPYHPLEGCKIE